jgi:nitroreductase
MEFKDVAQKRTSVRNFTDEKVNIDDLKDMIRLAGTAPCISGEETWRFIAVTNKELMQQMAQVVKQKYFEIIPANHDQVTENVKIAVEKFSSIFLNAPAVIAVTMRPYEAIIDKILNQTSYSHEELNELRNHPDIQTAGAAIQNLLLSAVDLGYGACWLTGPMVAKEELSKILKLESPYSLMAFVAVGKPDKEPKPRAKSPLENIFSIIE